MKNSLYRMISELFPKIQISLNGREYTGHDRLMKIMMLMGYKGVRINNKREGIQ